MSTNNLFNESQFANIEARMNNIKHDGMSQNEKTRSWNAIAEGLPSRSKTFSHVTLVARMQSRIVAVSVGILILLGGAATASAHNSKPGDVFFPVAVAGEKVQLLFTGNQKAKESLHIKFAERRLAEAKELAGAVASVSTSTTALGATTTTLSKGEAKKIARTTRGIEVALAQLAETRSALVAKGATDAVLIIDDIIAELKGVGSGRVSITHLSGGKNGKGNVSIRAAFTSTSTATSTLSGTIKIDEKKDGAKIVLRTADGSMKTSIALGNKSGKDKDEKGKDKSEKDHDDRDHDKGKNDKEDDDSDEHEDEKDRKHNEKKITVCHVSGNNKHSISISRNAVRPHLAHGDTLGQCRGIVVPPTGDTAAPTLANLAIVPAQGSAVVTWTTNESTTASLWLSTSSPVATGGTPAASRTSLLSSHSLALSSLNSSTTYLVIVSSYDASGNRATSSQLSFTTLPPTPSPSDVTSPVISGIETSGVGTTGATITWTTNEAAKTRLYISTSSVVDTSVVPNFEESGFVLAHSITRSGLTPNTTYRYILSAVDASGNRGTSSMVTFTTSALPPPVDTTAPILSGVSVSTTADSATITWNTNELSTALLYFGTADPVNFSGSKLTLGSLATSHSAVLSGLTASTTYRFVIVSKDGTGNTRTSSQTGFLIN